MKSKAERIRQVLGEAIRSCRLARSAGRGQIATELNVRLCLPWTDRNGGIIRRGITAADLNELTRSLQPGRGASLPAEWVADLCEVLGDDELALLLLPERLKKVLTVGELAIKSHGTLARALAELQKVVEPSAERKPGTGKCSATRRKPV